jgi:hypothetical protein
MLLPGGHALDAPAGTSALASLPLARWATRLRGGRVELAGRVPSDLIAACGAAEVRLCAGEVSAVVDFVGGPAAALTRVVVVAREGLSLGAIGGFRLELGSGCGAIDGEPLAEPGLPDVLGPFVTALLDRLADVAVSATAEPDGDIALRMGHGIEVIVPDGMPLTVRGASHGSPAALRLSEPLTVGFGGEGLRLSHEQFRFLARLSVVRLGRATLHPDGSVALEGRGGLGAELARAPLQKASDRLSELVRRSPGFHRVRAFLKHGDSR